MLLGGAVAGSVSDLGSVYYNPGFLALTNNPTFVVTAKLLQFTNVNIKDGLGENIDLAQNRFGSAPGLIAGVFELKFMPKSKFAYAYLTRRTHNLDFVYRTQSRVDALPNNPGKEDFTAEVIIKGESSVYWGGWTGSYSLNKHMSIGLSNFFTVNVANAALNVDLSARASDQHVVAVNRRLQYEYTNFGMILNSDMP